MMMKTHRIERITFKRQLELDMLDGSPQDLARIGIELGYTAAQQKFGIKDLVISESPRGLELYPRDRKALLKASMIDLRKTPSEKRRQKLVDAVDKVASGLSEGLGSDSSAEVGYGFIAHFEEDKAVSMEILEIRRG